MSSWKYSRVQLDMLAAELVAARITGFAAMSTEGKGPGISQDDAVQYVTRLSILRHYAACGAFHFQWAVYGKDGGFVRTVWVGRDEPKLEEGQTAVPMFGDERRIMAGGGGTGLPGNWGRLLVGAIDQVLHDIGKAEQAGSVPAGYGQQPEPAPPPVEAGFPVALAVIVGGAAVSIIATAAIWRYFAPEVLIAAAAVDGAARAYQMRLEHHATTGVMPPPSAVETEGAKVVGEAAAKAQGRGWLYAGVGVGGISAGAVGAGLIKKKVA